MNTTAANRNISFDILRILACLAVITYHTPGWGMINSISTQGSFEWTQYVVLNVLSKWGVPVFMMLTGYFLMSPNKVISIKDLFSKYILRVVTVLIFWNVVYAALYHNWLWHSLTESHMWYLGMLIGLYLIMPLLRLMATQVAVLRYFCYTWLGVLCYTLLGKFIILPVEIVDNIFVDSIGYCAWAYYLSTNPSEFKQWKRLYMVGGLRLCMMVICTCINPTIGGYVAEYHSPITALAAIAIFAWFMNHPVACSERVTQGILVASSVTLGVYMIHPYLLTHIFTRVLRFFPIPILSVLTSVFGAFVIGGVIALLVKKIPYVGKWIV